MGKKSKIRAQVQARAKVIEGQQQDQARQQDQVQEAAAFRYVSVTDMPLTSPARIVSPLLEADVLAMLFGEAAHGKSFFGLDLASSVATKISFHGLPIQRPGHVIYQLGEGISGFRRRLRAWEIARGVQLDGAPLSISTRPLGIIDKGAAETMVQAIDQASVIHGPPVLLVVDTLARNFGAGDESATKDMNQFIGVMDLIRTRYGCSILLVHHPGHADKTRGRGAYSLPAAIDANYRLDKDDDGLIRLEALKMKDAELPPPMAFRLAQVDLGLLDDEGEPVTSAVLTTAQYSPRPGSGKIARGKWQSEALLILEKLATDQGSIPLEAWRRHCLAAGMSRQTWAKVRKSLPDSGVCSINNLDEVFLK